MDLLTGDALMPASCQYGCARDVATLFSYGLRTAVDHVINQCCVETIALGQRTKRGRSYLDRRYLSQGPIRPSAPTRRSHVVIYVSLGHTSPASFQ